MVERVTTTWSYEFVTRAISVLAVVICLLLPILIVAQVEHTSTVAPTGNAEVTVGIAMILRASFRRLLRTSTRHLARTAFGTFSRTVARTVTRRFVRVAMHWLISLFSKASFAFATDAQAESRSAMEERVRSACALLVGFAAVAMSFWGVVHVSSLDDVGTGFLGTRSAYLLAALPVLVYGAVTWALSRGLQLQLRCVTAVDGLLIQGYFTGAGSFLPVATDFEVKGGHRNKAIFGFLAIATLYVVHLVLIYLSQRIESEALTFSAAMFLVYCFVYAFPISPLQGHDVWSFSKLLWLAMFAPILGSFLLNFPNELSQII